VKPLASLSIAALALSPLLVKDAGDPASDGGVVTLLSADDLLSSFDFRSGSRSAAIFDGEIDLRGVQVVYETFLAGHLTIGFSRDERVDLLDLGDVEVVPVAHSRDRTEEFPVSVFHTLFRDDNGFSFIAPEGDVDPCEAASRILKGVPPQGMRHIVPVAGHVYILRLRRNDTSRDEFFKLQVLGVLPGHSLTFRWAPL
jgi:hypothetical protein